MLLDALRFAAQLTFKYTEQGPQGLLLNKKAIVVVASGGVPIGSEMDFASGYLRQVLGFIGITDVSILDASQFSLDEPTEKFEQQFRELVSS